MALCLFLGLGLFTPSLEAYVHVHPTPTLPSTVNFHGETDVFSIGLIKQIHKTLFTVENGHAVPQLLSKIRYDKLTKTYTWTVKNAKFSNGKKLLPSDIKFSIEKAIRQKTSGYQKLSKVLHIKALDQNGSLKLMLSAPDYSLAKTLSEFRFSVVPAGDHSYRVGLGAFGLQKLSKNKVTIRRIFSRTEPSGGSPSVVEYKKVPGLSQALSGFKKGAYHDLWSFALNKGKYAAVKAANKSVSAVPRTYLALVNPRSIKNQSERREIVASIPRATIAHDCYDDSPLSDSIVPRGFSGYSDTVRLRASKAGTYKKPLRVQISKGVGSEACVEKAFRARFPSADIKVTETLDGLADWNKSGVDIWFIYSEAENTLDFFQYFQKNSSFFIGSPTALALRDHSGFLSWPQAEQHKYHQSLLDMHTAVPIFHPLKYLVYDKRYKPLAKTVYGSFMIQFKDLKSI